MQKILSGSDLHAQISRNEIQILLLFWCLTQPW